MFPTGTHQTAGMWDRSARAWEQLPEAATAAPPETDGRHASHPDFRTVGETAHSPGFLLRQFLQPHCPRRGPQPALSPAHWEGPRNDSSEGQTWPQGLRVLSGQDHASFTTSWPVASAFPNPPFLMSPGSTGGEIKTTVRWKVISSQPINSSINAMGWQKLGAQNHLIF